MKLLFNMTHLLCYIKGIFVQNQREREELADEKSFAFPDHLTPLRTLMAEVVQSYLSLRVLLLKSNLCQARAPTKLRLYQKISLTPDPVVTGDFHRRRSYFSIASLQHAFIISCIKLPEGSRKSLDVMDKKMFKLQELRERELAFKDSYSIFDEMFMCFRCLFD